LGFILLSTRSFTKPLLIALKWFINFPAPALARGGRCELS
jgi:hypothetical protein